MPASPDPTAGKLALSVTVLTRMTRHRVPRIYTARQRALHADGPLVSPLDPPRLARTPARSSYIHDVSHGLTQSRQSSRDPPKLVNCWVTGAVVAPTPVPPAAADPQPWARPARAGPRPRASKPVAAGMPEVHRCSVVKRHPPLPSDAARGTPQRARHRTHQPAFRSIPSAVSKTRSSAPR